MPIGCNPVNDAGIPVIDRGSEVVRPEFALGEPRSVDVDSLKWGELATVLGRMSGYIMASGGS